MAVMEGLALAAWRHVRASRDVDLLISVSEQVHEPLLRTLTSAGLRPKHQPPLISRREQLAKNGRQSQSGESFAPFAGREDARLTHRKEATLIRVGLADEYPIRRTPRLDLLESQPFIGIDGRLFWLNRGDPV
jgi:hypothetical protein